MAKLTLKLNGKILQTIELESGTDYYAGRASECDFPLEDYRGISRQHLKIFESDGVWYCESLSKFLHPKLGEENFESLGMNESVSFSLPPYEFEFETEAVSQEEPLESHGEGVKENHALVPFASSIESSSSLDDDSESPAEYTQVGGSSDATAVGSIQLSSTLRICYPSSSDNETLKLEGQVWTAGRESDCEIQLHNPKVSRKHFELTKNPEGYFVTDLGSSNGTYLNGQKLPPHEPTRMMSGDHLRVLDIELHFEVKASNLPAVTAQPLALAPPWVNHSMNALAIPGPYEYEATQLGHVPSLEESVPKTPIEKFKSFDWKKNKVRVAIGALIPVLLFSIFSEPEKKPQEDAAVAGANTNASFDNLSPEQKTAIKDSLGLARNLYVQGKYSLCLAELAKLHETIPFYDNSKELESFCIQGHELTQRKLDNDRKEREKAMVEQQIADITATCTEKYNNQGSVEEVRKCLAGAIELNPEHPKIIELIQRAEDRLREKELLAQRARERAQKRRSILNILELAQKYRDQGDLIKARSTYKRFISRADGSLSSQKSEAQRELASVSKTLEEKISLLMEKCRALGESEKYREAYQACDEAVKEDPSVKDAEALKEKYANTLRRQMKVLYQDAKLEESLGNLEAAKEKWKKIRAEDLESGSFYKKATIKLRQYGVI